MSSIEVNGDTLFGDVVVRVAAARPYHAARDGSVSLGPLPAGCTVLGVRTGIIGKHALVVIATDKGVFVAEPGHSKLTRLEPCDAPQG